MTAEQEIKNEIDNYSDTVFAIIGFMNFYRFDDKKLKMREDVLLFQGRRLTPSPSKSKSTDGGAEQCVTPDLGILPPSGPGVLGEVKRSFPKNQDYWLATFQQLMGYDDDLTGWPCPSQKVASHDLVLLLHLTRGAAVTKFYEQNRGKTINFARPFCIMEFNRSSEGQEYIFFRSRTGAVSDKAIADRLENGVSVPLAMFLLQYSTVKLYDSAPPLPYLLELIWTQVVALKATSAPDYKMPTKAQKLKVEVSIDEITERLVTQFSFHLLQTNHNDSRQPRILKQSMVQEACAALVKFKDADWADNTKTRLTVNFVKREDVLDYYIGLCAKEEKHQMDLFKEKDAGTP